MNKELLRANIQRARQQWTEAQQRQTAAYQEMLRLEGYIAASQEILNGLEQGEATPPAPPIEEAG